MIQFTPIKNDRNLNNKIFASPSKVNDMNNFSNNYLKRLESKECNLSSYNKIKIAKDEMTKYSSVLAPKHDNS